MTAHMTAGEFRRQGHAVVDWVADYLTRVEEFPVLSRVAPGAVRAALPEAPPEDGEPFEAILADLDDIVLPGITHWQSPGFHAYFPGNSSGPSILGELVSAGLGVQGMLWATSPACTELETHVLDWMARALALPECYRSDSTGGGVIQDSASSSVLCALLAARERVTQGHTNQHGLDGSHLVAYTSSQAHSSIEKAVRITGIGSANLRLIPVDESFAMRPDALAAAIASDRDRGLTPFFVAATVGTTSSLAMDPVPAIAAVTRAEGLWLHVDAAMAGVAALCPEYRFVVDGLEQAESFCTNVHKWLVTNFDCSLFWVADRGALTGALGLLPEYLRNAATASGQVIDYRDWQVPLGRRFRALKLWFVLRWYGLEALRAILREHVALTAELAERLAADPRFVPAAPCQLNLVCFRHRDGDDATRAVLDGLNATGEVYLSHTVLDGHVVARVHVGNSRTERRHVERLWGLIDQLA